MIVSVLIVGYSTGGVLFSRYYGHQVREEKEQAAWLKKLRDATAPDWHLLKEDGPEQVAAIGEVQVLYKLIGDVVLILAGTEEHDVLLQLELARAMTVTIKKACKIPDNPDTRVSAERRILQHYANLCLVIDEHIDDGDVDLLDPRVIMQLIKMKPTK